MPLLPGETRETDTYRSGLSFIDPFARGVRRWADRTQASAEEWYRGLSWPRLDTGYAGAGGPMVRNFEGSYSQGPLVPAIVNWDHPELWRVMIPSFASCAITVSRLGDPLKKCPGTVLLILGNACVFTHRLPLAIWSLRAIYVVEGRQFYRLLSAPFLHADLSHLISNMMRVLNSGYVLEPRRGGWGFLLEAIAVAACTSIASVAAAVASHRLLGDAAAYYQTCSVGFSGVSFALSVMAQHEAPQALQTGFLGLPGQWRQFSCWIELAFTHLLVPRADLTTHICGICVGLARVYLPRNWPALERALGGRGGNFSGGGNVLGMGGAQGGRGWQGGGGRLGRCVWSDDRTPPCFRARITLPLLLAGRAEVWIGRTRWHPLHAHALLALGALLVLPLAHRHATAPLGQMFK